MSERPQKLEYNDPLVKTFLIRSKTPGISGIRTGIQTLVQHCEWEGFGIPGAILSPEELNKLLDRLEEIKPHEDEIGEMTAEQIASLIIDHFIRSETEQGIDTAAIAAQITNIRNTLHNTHLLGAEQVITQSLQLTSRQDLTKIEFLELIRPILAEDIYQTYFATEEETENSLQGNSISEDPEDETEDTETL